jgi:hypothetical protein
MFRNSVRLLFSNFATVWKILVYKIIAAVTTVAIASIFAIKLVEVLNNNNFFETAKQEFSAAAVNFNIYYILSSVATIINSFVDIVSANLSTVLGSLILTLITLVIFGSFLSSLSDLAVSETLNGYMSSNANYSFTAMFVKNFPKSIKLSLTKIFINLPINLLIIFLIYKMLPMLTSTNELVVIFSPFIIITLSTILMALNLTVFSGVVPAIIVHDAKILEGYKQGFVAVNRRFYKTFSTSAVIILTILVVNLFFLTLTGGASLIITFPSSIFLLAIFSMVMYYGSMGMRYYVDPETILTPKKLEEQDKVNKAKFII